MGDALLVLAFFTGVVTGFVLAWAMLMRLLRRASPDVLPLPRERLVRLHDPMKGLAEIDDAS